MLTLDMATDTPLERELVAFFGEAQSVDAVLDGLKLALWCPKGPPAALTAAQRYIEDRQGLAAFGWPRGRSSGRQSRSRLGTARVAVAGVLATPALFEPGQRVVLARRELPRAIFAELAARLEYQPDLLGQVLGWWYGLDDELPATRPLFRETGGVFPEGGTLEDGVSALVLVEVNDCWLVLSERGLLTYRFGLRLVDEHEVKFVRANVDLEIWRARLIDPTPPGEVLSRFGQAAAERARHDAGAVTVRCTRER